MRTISNIESVSQIPELEKMGVKIEFTPENEDTDITGYFEEQNIIQIQNKYNSGNMAAWFCAKVEVSFRGISETDYLGCCSYNSFKEFESDESGYYVDMINNCITQINKQINSNNFQIQKSWNIRRAINLVQPYGYYVFQAVLPNTRK
jgi:hypothetical protein